MTQAAMSRRNPSPVFSGTHGGDGLPTIKRSKILDFKTYEPDPKKSLVERAAHALDWAAQNFPKQWVPVNLLLKGIMGYAHTPRLTNEEVDSLRKKMSRIRKIMAEQYGRGLISERGFGVRASIDSEDQLKKVVSAAAARVASANKGLKQAADLVNISEVPDTEDNKPWKEWWNGKRGGVGLRAQIAAVPNLINLLLPPSEGSKPDGEK
jgi:hypothetical protein